ncbi:MAG: penicillin-binding protein activator LpoB [Treponema sp.]|jgi:TolB-like protein|nr:penicillin-binding protein activator LpoB [Treponema sp.]
MMKRKVLFVKVISIVMILILFNGCVSSTMMMVAAIDPSGMQIVGASVTIDGQMAGVTPIAGKKVSNFVGKNTRIAVAKEGYNPATKNAEKEMKGANLALGLLLNVFAFLWISGPKAQQIVTLTPTGAMSSSSTQSVQPDRTRGSEGFNKAIDLICGDLVAKLPRNSVIAVLEITSNTRENRENAAFACDEIEYQLGDAGKFKIVDRNALDRIREEQNFQMSGEVSDSTAVSVGNMLGANIVITGSITGSGNTQRLTVKALDVKTAQILVNAREQF